MFVSIRICIFIICVKYKIHYRSMQGNWCPKSVLFYNLLFFVCIFWAVHNIESDEPLQFVSYNGGGKRELLFFVILNLLLLYIFYRHFS